MFQLYFLKYGQGLFDSIFYLNRQLFTPEVIIVVGITVLKTTQANTEFMG